MRVRYLFVLLLLPIFQASAVHAAPLKIVTSFTILADMAHEVGGDNVHIESLVGPDGDAHVYEPTPKDVRAVAGADMVIVNGLGFEGWMDRLIQSAGFKGRIVVASAGITPLMLGNTPDPHAWQSIGNGKAYVLNIENALTAADPPHAAMYEKNATRYLRELGELDSWVRSQIARIPRTKRIAITSHDALHYFGESYGIAFIAPLGLSTSGDVSAGEIAALIDQLRAQHVRAVFLENMADPRLTRQLVKDGGAVIGGTLYSDALSAAGGPAPTYTEMFRHNVVAMVETMRKN